MPLCPLASSRLSSKVFTYRPISPPPKFLSAISGKTLNPHLYRARLLEQRRELALLLLQVRVPTNVHVVDEDVGHGPLAANLLESGLDGCAVVWKKTKKPLA